MVITEVATSPGLHFLLVVLEAVQKSHLFSVFAHLGKKRSFCTNLHKRKGSEP